MLTKICTIDDIPDIIDMYTKAKQWQNKHQPDKKFEVWTNHEFIKKRILDDRVKIAGVWENGNMIAAVVGRFSKSIPNWTLSSIITNIRTPNLNLRENGIADATELLIDLAEKNGYYKFYTVVSERQYKNERVMKIFQQHIPALQEYVYVTEARILPNEFTSFEAFNSMLTIRVGTTWSDAPIYIRSATALDSRRNFNILMINTITGDFNNASNQ